jgi:hypothetical protein
VTKSARALSGLDRFGIQSVRFFSLGLGCAALLLDLTLIGIGVGMVLATVGIGYGLLCPRDDIRKVALSLNAFALGVPAVFVLLGLAGAGIGGG